MLLALLNTFASIVIFGSLLAGLPLSRLGTNGGGGRTTRCLGFDILRGQFGRVASGCICAPALFLLLSAPAHVKCAVLLPVALLLAWWLRAAHTSHPGGPRAHRILREPQWPDKTWHVDAGWRCAVAEESHERTHAELPNGQKLTGEPAGRQTWHREPGGKETVGFNPSKNPNPDDSVWRAQRVAAWKAKGGSVPSDSWRVTGPLDAARKAMAWYQVLQSDDGHWAGDYGGPLSPNPNPNHYPDPKPNPNPNPNPTPNPSPDQVRSSSYPGWWWCGT
tara:strand:- start:1387 stop:2217 length:831 start_codon:yes stop_codon:yes gene_type:complete